MSQDPFPRYIKIPNPKRKTIVNCDDQDSFKIEKKYYLKALISLRVLLQIATVIENDTAIRQLQNAVIFAEDALRENVSESHADALLQEVSETVREMYGLRS